MSSGPQQKENQLRQLLSEIRMMEGSSGTLQQRLQQVIAAVSELRMAKNSLGDLKQVESGTNLLVPVGGGAFINAEMGGIDNVVVGIGAGVSVKMQYEDAVTDVNDRLSEMEKARASVEEQLGQILAQLETHQGMAERLSAEIQNAVQGSI